MVVRGGNNINNNDDDGHGDHDNGDGLKIIKIFYDVICLISLLKI